MTRSSHARSRSGAFLAVLALAVGSAAGGCSMASTSEETAPPGTPLPSLRTPSSDASSELPETALPATPDPESSYQQLLASVPESIRPACDRAQPGRRELASVTCDLESGGGDTVAYAQFDSAESMDASFRAVLEDLPARATDGPGCGRGPGEERLAVGRRACFRTSDGTAVVLWTNDLVYVLGEARRADGDFGRLDAFWRTAGPITP